MRNLLSGNKTYLTGFGGILVAVGMHLQGQMELAPTVQTVVGSLLAIFLRRGVAKVAS